MVATVHKRGEGMQEKAIRVLLVEDNPDDALSISEMLAGTDEVEFQLRHVSRLTDALDTLAEGEFDVFLVDLALPDSTSEQTLERIRHVNLPIVVVTGAVREEFVLNLYLSGAQDYLVKGKVDGKVLSLAIRYAVARFQFLTNEEKQLHAIERLERTNLQLKVAAEMDSLTGLLNRRGAENVVGIEASRSMRTGADLSAVVFDYDDFKAVNDRHGHAVGDDVLRMMTERMRTVCRPTDHLARIGGDEFLLLLPETRVREAGHVAERMRKAIAEIPCRIGPKSIPMSASFAVTLVDPEQATVREILVATQEALKVGKSAGKNRVETRKSAAAEPSEAPGPDNGDDRTQELRVVRQPIYDLWKHRLLGFEMLTRCRVGSVEARASSLFLSVEGEALAALDLECLRRCVAATTSLPPSARAHINLFPSTIVDGGSRQILDAIGEAGGSRRFCVEISERRFVGDLAALRKGVAELAQGQVQIGLDDVGFGRSALETLILLEPDFIKVDRRHVHGAAGDARKRRSLKRLLDVASSLDCDTIAEGIETKTDLDAITDVGIRYGQGYLWGKPGETATGEWSFG